MNILSSDFSTLRISHAIQLSGFITVVYDYLLTFSEEVALIWRGRWGLASILYLFTRYLVFIDSAVFLVLALDLDAPPSRCHTYLAFVGWCWCIGLFVAQSILILRTYAICNSNRYLIIALVIVHIASNAAVWTINSQFLKAVTFLPNMYPEASALSGCWMISLAPSGDLWVSYLVILLNETVIVVTTILYILRDGGYGCTPLVRTVQRDGVFFYIYLQALSIFNILFIRFATPDFHLNATIQSLHRVFHAILTARMLLNIRRAAFPDQGLEGITSNSIEKSAIEFRRVTATLSTLDSESIPSTYPEEREFISG